MKKEMKRKISIIVLIALILFSNYSFTYAYTEGAFTREAQTSSNGVKSVYDNAFVINSEDKYLDGIYNANSVDVITTQIKVFKYNTTEPITVSGNMDTSNIQTDADTYNATTQKGYYFSAPSSQRDNKKYVINYSVKLPETNEFHASNLYTVLYKEGLSYNGKSYDIQLNIKGIDKYGTGTPVFSTTVAVAEPEVINDSNYDSLLEAQKFNFANYTAKTKPMVGISYGGNDKVYVSIEYKILEKGSYEKGSPKQASVSGVVGFNDMDNSSGFFLEGTGEIKGKDASIPTLYTTQATLDKDGEKGSETYGSGVGNIFYKSITPDNGKQGTFFYHYSDTMNNTEGGTFYVLEKEKNQLNIVKTFDHTGGERSGIVFSDGGLLRYHFISTEVEGPGTISNSITNIKNGENKKITYSPNENAYLKSITVDGQTVSTTQFENEYNFTDIQADHSIKVVYGTKLNVRFDPKGGSPTPDTQVVVPNAKATEPSNNPTKNGYTFDDWYLQNETTPYDFNTPVTHDITLEAKWNPIIYHINYELDNGTNDPENPSQYTVEDTVTFKNPTKTGYIFEGWYTDSTFTTPITELPRGTTGDKTIYAKWTADVPDEANYVVKHFKENKDGEYDLATTDEFQDEVGKEVTAEAKTFKGYHENRTHEDRVPTATIDAEGTTELKLYYDKDDYTVTFKPENGESDTKQTVPYEEKATEIRKPTKDGYEFDGWFHDDTRYDFDTPVVEDITLVAKWTPVETQQIDDGKKDDTTAKTPIPQTGQIDTILAVAGAMTLILAGIFIVYRIKKNKN